MYENGYEQDIVVGGLLHDTLEWTDVNEQMLRNQFGDHIFEIVQACSKDNSILDKDAKTNDLVERCIKCGQDALIVKAADILDSYKWYTLQKNESELEYCARNANAILKLKPDDFKDKIFNKLKKWL